MPKKALGRGLSAILSDLPESAAAPAPARKPLPDSAEKASGRSVLEVPLGLIDPNPRQPRRLFDPEKLEELARSVANEGVLMPILLTRRGERFEIVAGERRFRACLKAGLETVPALVGEADSRESLKLALVENLQRDDLNPVEEARAYQVMINEFGWTHEELGEHLGKQRSTVSNTLRLLQLPEEVQSLVASGEVSAGHVRALIRLDRGDCLRVARDVALKQLSVRQTERLANRLKAGAPGKRSQSLPGDPVLLAIRERLEGRLGLPVELHYRKGKGRVEIRFTSDRELERVMEALSVSLDSEA